MRSKAEAPPDWSFFADTRLWGDLTPSDVRFVDGRIDPKSLLRFATASMRRADFEKTARILRRADLFERDASGLWVYRHSSEARMLALAEYRHAQELAETYDPSTHEWASKPVEAEVEVVYRFCDAITVSPEAVKDALRRFPLGRSQPYFDKAARFCSMEGGFRTRLASPSDDWWVYRAKMTEGEMNAMMQLHYERREYSDVWNLWGKASARWVFEQRNGSWWYRRNDINRFVVLAYFMDDLRKDSYSGYGFCIGLRVLPTTVKEAAKQVTFGDRARVAFERSLRECDNGDGWHSTEAPFPDP
jgi:hypothetical protein